jgi:hypothetical protein
MGFWVLIISFVKQGLINIPANSGWQGSGIKAVLAPSEVSSVQSSSFTCWSLGSSREDPLEIVPDSEDEDLLVIPPPPRMSWWDSLARIVEILNGQDIGIAFSW